MMTFEATADGIANAMGKAGRVAREATRFGVIAAIAFGASAASAQQLDPPIDAQVEANEAGAASQTVVEGIADETDSLTGDYRLTLKKIESLQIFNRQLAEVIESQNEELASYQAQIDSVEEVGRSVTPLMLRMIEALDQFVKFDIPFLVEERTKRVDSLRVLMRRSDVAEPERYRRILEAYQIENDYGRTIDAHPGTIDKDGAEVPVDFLRVGRIGLMYKTRDGAEYGVWDRENETWQTLDTSDYANWIDEGLRVAKKQAAPQLIRVPLPQPGGQS